MHSPRVITAACCLLSIASRVDGFVTPVSLRYGYGVNRSVVKSTSSRTMQAGSDIENNGVARSIALTGAVTAAYFGCTPEANAAPAPAQYLADAASSLTLTSSSASQQQQSLSSSSSSSSFGISKEILERTVATATTSLGSSSSFLAAATTTSAPANPATTAAKIAPAAASTNVAAGSGVTITDIFYDGVVPKTESDEYVVVSNQSKSTVDISKYYIYVATTGTQGPTFYFPKDASLLKPGASVRVYTNEIHKESGGYSFGSGKAIWSNNGGLAVLKDANGKKIAEYKYKPVKQ